MTATLPDVTGSELKLLICGTAAGPRSAAEREYYAGRGNQLWKTLYRLGATPRLLHSSEFTTLPSFGIGLTDLAKNTSGRDQGLPNAAFDRERLMNLIKRLQPTVLVFNGKRAAQIYFGQKAVSYGYQESHDVGHTRVFIAPSTSGAARRWWDEEIWRKAIISAGFPGRVTHAIGNEP